MSGRMNWDRVRVESRARLRGSEWVDSSSRVVDSSGRLVPPPKRKKKKGLASKRSAQTFPARLRMPGCSCGKPVSFKGEHRKSCSLRGGQGSPKTPAGKTTLPPVVPLVSKHPVKTIGAESPSLSEFVIRMNRIGLDRDLKHFLRGVVSRLAHDKRSLPSDKEDVNQAVRSMLADIEKYA